MVDKEIIAPLIVRRKDRGFTLVELVVAIGLIAILAALGAFMYRDIVSRAADAHALSEGQGLLSAASEAFLADEDVFFTVADDVTGPVGNVRQSDGLPRSPIFKLSPKIRASITGESPPGVGGGFLTYDIWSLDGSTKYRFEIDEDDNVLSTPVY
jgi:prepilin-type N-terminal cleavage/methylation domain-containing protein